MSGHSHYATIHRQKEIKDAARGQLYSKLARGISLAIKAGGPSVDSNFKLKVAIEKARAAGLPKDNIDRAIARAEGAESIEEVTYEGYGPEGLAIVVEAATDNRNRTSQEIKNIFERVGGRLGGPGSVSFNFEQKGFILVEKQGNTEEQILGLIDCGVEDFEETDDGIEVYVSPETLSSVRKTLEDKGLTVKSSELELKPRQLVTLEDPSKASKVLSFLDSLESHEDVQRVFANVDIPEEVLKQVNS